MSRRTQIIDALIEKFELTGFTTDFTMSELAECVNIGKSTLYEYFSHKDDIIKSAIYKFVTDRFDEIKISVAMDEMDFETAFKAQLKVLLVVGSKSRSLLETLSPGFIQKLPDSMREEIKTNMEDIKKQMNERFISFFVKGIKEGVIDQEKVNEQKGLIITSLVVGSIFTYTGPQSKLDLDIVVETIYNTTMLILNN